MRILRRKHGVAPQNALSRRLGAGVVDSIGISRSVIAATGGKSTSLVGRGLPSSGNNLGFHHARPVRRPPLFNRLLWLISDALSRGATMATLIRRLFSDDDGPTAVEYAVMLALIVGACLASVNLVANAAGDSFDDSSAQLAGVLGP